MSHHEWNYTMYGIELPNSNPDNDKILAFIENHKEVFAWFTDENYYPTNDNIDEFLYDYEDDMGYTGVSVLIADVANNMFIVPANDQYGNEFVGMYATTMFPWHHGAMGGEWKSITPEYIESKVRPIVEELYGTCPDFTEHTIWQNG